MEIIIFILGFLAGIVFTVYVVARAGYNAVKADLQQHRNLYKTKPCKNHEWCEEHAAQGQYHCVKCGYAMEQ